MTKKEYSFTITFNDDNDRRFYLYSGYITNDGEEVYDLGLDTNPNIVFDDILKDKYLIQKAFDSNMAFEFGIDSEPNLPMNYDEFVNSDYIVKINGTKEEVVNFINNSIFKEGTKIYVIDENCEMNINSKEFLEFLVGNLNSIDNVYTLGDGNMEPVNIIDYLDTVIYIDEVSSKEEKHNFSQLEKLMYIFDIVRDRKYILENKDEEKKVSRDLTSVLKGDKIVCLGFSEIFDKICRRLGMVSNVELYCPTDDSKIGHARNEVYVDDDKYNIKGIFFFDPTLGCKSKDDNSHFDSYFSFAKPYHFFKAYDIFNKRNYESVRIKLLEQYISKDSNGRISTKNMLNYSIEYKNITGIELFTNQESSSLFVLYVLNKKELPDELYDEYNKRISKSLRLLFSELSKEDFLKILTNVRIKEYYENEEKFPLSVDKIIEITDKSVKEEETDDERLLRIIFNEPKPSTSDIIKTEEIDKKIERVKLTKVLRLTLERMK